MSSQELWRTDLRVGVGLAQATRSVEKGRLFSSSLVAFRQAPDLAVGFVAAIAGAEIRDTMLRFGGDGRAAHMERVDVSFPEPDFHRIASEKRARLVLTAPGIFERGWLPTGASCDARGVVFDLHGVRGRLVCAAVPRAAVVSGFDLAAWRPKPAVRCAPVGSVYWLDELEATPQTLRKLVEIGLWPTELHSDARRSEGFNRVTVALYGA